MPGLVVTESRVDGAAGKHYVRWTLKAACVQDMRSRLAEAWAAKMLELATNLTATAALLPGIEPTTGMFAHV
jgi:hypothetical protein